MATPLSSWATVMLAGQRAPERAVQVTVVFDKPATAGTATVAPSAAAGPAFPSSTSYFAVPLGGHHATASVHTRGSASMVVKRSARAVAPDDAGGDVGAGGGDAEAGGVDGGGGDVGVVEVGGVEVDDVGGGVVGTDVGGVAVGVAGIAAGGAGTDPAPSANCHVHEAVALVPAGCMRPTVPFTAGALEPLAIRLAPGAGRVTATTGNAHSNASAAIGPGVCGLPSMTSCWEP